MLKKSARSDQKIIWDYSQATNRFQEVIELFYQNDLSENQEKKQKGDDQNVYDSRRCL